MDCVHLESRRIASSVDMKLVANTLRTIERAIIRRTIDLGHSGCDFHSIYDSWKPWVQSILDFVSMILKIDIPCNSYFASGEYKWN